MALNSYMVSATIPSYWGWTTYTPVIPKLYWDVYSQEERIKRLCKEYDKLTHYASMIAIEVNELSGDIDATLEEFTQKTNEQLEVQNAKVEAKLSEMREYIDQKFSEFAQGTQTYDVTTGEYRPSYQAMRRLFQALSYDHKGDEQLVSFYATKTVGEFANQTVYNAAYSNRPSVVIDDQY